MRRHPLRFRLTLLFCAVSVASSAVLLLIMSLLVTRVGVADVRAPDTPPGVIAVPVPHEGVSAEELAVPAIALAIMAVLSLLLGWFIAGRMLRPVLTMTGRLQRISERTVHERLSLPGPRTELKDLADTVDGLLGRLEKALGAHKRFVANAAHELRTPLTVERALLEEPLIDPDASLESFRANFERLLVITDRRGQLLESLLTLSSTEYHRAPARPVDVSGLIEQALRDVGPEAARRGVRLDVAPRPQKIHGDEVLLARLVANLCDNAVHYNVDGGTVEVSVRRKVGRVVLSVANTGQEVPPEQVARLFEPFQRLRRTTDDGHHGLGLSIVRAIAAAHGAEVSARARPGGGLAVDVTFPAV